MAGVRRLGEGDEGVCGRGEEFREGAVAAVSEFAGKDDDVRSDEAGVDVFSDGCDRASGLVSEDAGKGYAAAEDAVDDEGVVARETARGDLHQRLAGIGARLGQVGVAESWGRVAARRGVKNDGLHSGPPSLPFGHLPLGGRQDVRFARKARFLPSQE